MWDRQSMGFPEPQGLYDSRNEHDACGVGFVAHIKGEKAMPLLRRHWKF
jgi:glutamate synthase (NADPH/NADH) large chain